MARTIGQHKRVKKSLQSSQKKQSKTWADYHSRIAVIDNMRISSMARQRKRVTALEKVRGKVSDTWGNYRQRKFRIYNPSRFGGLDFTKRKTSKGSIQEYYNIKDVNNLDNILALIFEKPQVRYVLVIGKIRLEEGRIQIVSDVFTRPAYNELRNRGETALEAFFEKLSFLQQYDGYELLTLHLRVIYENPKTRKNPKKSG